MSNGYNLPGSAMPMASQLFQIALNSGANPTLAAYLVGSAYQESGFKPGELGDFSRGRPTSFGLMQVGSPSLGSGTATEQFQKYIEAFQRRAPETWAKMNQAMNPQEAYAAQHENPDWRMGIPGGRFDYANQIMATQPGYENLPSYLASQPTQAGTPPPLYTGGMLTAPNQSFASTMSSRYPAQPGAQMGTWADYAAATTPPPESTPLSRGLTALGAGISKVGAQQQTSLAQGSQAAMSLLAQRQPPPAPDFDWAKLQQMLSMYFS
jgi:hypothetical protein